MMSKRLLDAWEGVSYTGSVTFTLVDEDRWSWKIDHLRRRVTYAIHVVEDKMDERGVPFNW